MSQKKSLKEIVKCYAKSIALCCGVGVACGSASAVFLLALDEATHFRSKHPILLFLLPIGGVIVGGLYHYFGKKVDRGNDLIIDEFHDPQTVIPLRMAPLVFVGTILTHFFGGSAGREGTAVQMGGSIADQFSHHFKLTKDERRTLLMAGMSGGFASVFGVPFAGTIFGLEVLTIGKLQIRSAIECAVSAFVAHNVTLAIGVKHTAYIHPLVTELSLKSVLTAIIAGAVFGVAARLFAFLSHQISAISKKIMPYGPLRAGFGGAIIATLYFGLPFLQKFAGLGVPEIVEAMKTQIPIYDWLGKTVMTALTIGTGFKGGEVTPLLYIGATLGNALSRVLPLALPLLASMGLVGVFAGAANTPFACTFMAMELFGADVIVYAAIACFASFAMSGRQGIYRAQKSRSTMTH